MQTVSTPLIQKPLAKMLNWQAKPGLVQNGWSEVLDNSPLLMATERWQRSWRHTFGGSGRKTKGASRWPEP